MQVVGVQIKAMHRIREIGFSHAEFVQLKVGAHKIAHALRDVLIDHVLQLETLKLHFVRHTSQTILSPPELGYYAFSNGLLG